ncbi:MAG: arsenate reductase family protein [Myxococcota bacterium]
MSLVVYHYPNCSTCKKALAFLREHNIEFRAKDIVETPPSETLLRKAHKLSGLALRKLFNTSGKSYREGGFKDRLDSMSERDAIRALAADGKLIKRPLVFGDGFALVGFQEDQWGEVLGL